MTYSLLYLNENKILQLINRSFLPKKSNSLRPNLKKIVFIQTAFLPDTISLRN